MDVNADPVLGTQSSHEEPQSHLTTAPRGSGWRALAAPMEVEAYFGHTWVRVLADEINDESREVWVRAPHVAPGDPAEVHHEVLDASHYRLLGEDQTG